MYQTLYRKYRPKTFGDIVGQDVIVKVLRNSINNGKIAHAYMFIGPRGTGKTSTAKIFARAVNCLTPNNGDICGKCDNCLSSSNNDCLDIIEIDAASNNGVDEIRNLKEKVSLVPSELKYKVYIIDEVHMLTIQAFNALLKTLEEPPEHIIFILATTDPQKVPETIISRCQCFNFCRISEENIVKNLENISKKESITVEKEVLNQIAIVSDGGMRDSIGMLDKLSSYSNENITIDDFIKISGLVTNNDIENLINNICGKNIPDVIKTLEDWNNAGSNLIQIMAQILDYLKNKLVNTYIKGNFDENTDIYQQLANLINEKMIEIRKSSNPRIYIEIMLLNFMSTNVGNTISQENISNKIISREIISDKNSENKSDKKEKKVETVKKEITSNVEKTKKESNIDEIMKIRINNTFVNATKTELNSVKDKMKVLDQYTYDLNIGYLASSLIEGNIRLASDKYVVISYKYESMVRDNLENLTNLERLINSKANIDKKIAIITDEKWEMYAKKFIEDKKNGLKYELIAEPELMFDVKNIEKKNTNNSSNLDDFSDILEVN